VILKVASKVREETAVEQVSIPRKTSLQISAAAQTTGGTAKGSFSVPGGRWLRESRERGGRSRQLNFDPAFEEESKRNS